MTTTSFGTTPKPSNLSHIYKHRHYNHSRANVSFRFSNSPKLTFSSKGLHSSLNHSAVVRAQLNEVRFFRWFALKEIHSYFVSFMENLLEPSVAFKVVVGGSSNDAATLTTLSEEVSSDAKDVKLPSETSSAPLLSEESISDFLSQVSSLVKLVNSTDISELQLKQLDCELLIRKKEALPQPPPPPAPTYAPLIQSHSVPAVQPSTPHAHVPAPTPTPTPAPSPAAAKPSYPSLPPLKSPMAGTFYRSPAPSEPPFVKVGDKVQKGQVLCIIEAMKLMNEIEADKSGTIVETVAEDGKPVSVDTPLFVIKP